MYCPKNKKFLVDPFVVQFVLDGIKDRAFQLFRQWESHSGNLIFSSF